MSLLTTLNHEWEQTLAAAPLHRGWLEVIPELRAGVDLADVLALTREHPHTILWHLVNLAQSGDELASRVVVQSMLPKLVLMSTTGRARTYATALDDFIVALSARIATYPLHRTSPIAGNLALDTLADAQRFWRAQEPDQEIPTPELILHLHLATEPPPEEPSLTVEDVLSSAESRHWLTSGTAAVLREVYSDGAPTSAEAGHRLGMAAATVRSRCRNGLALLRQHAPEIAGLAC